MSMEPDEQGEDVVVAPSSRHFAAGAVIGVLSAAVALGVAQLAAGVIDAASSPIVAVGSSAIDATPEWLKSFAIRTFGTADKVALLVGIGTVLCVAAVLLGIVSVRRPRVGIVALVVLGAIGVLAATTRPSSGSMDAIPSILGMLAGAAAFLWLRSVAGFAPIRTAPASDPDPRATEVPGPGIDRRRFLLGGAAVAAVAAASGGIGQFLVRRSAATASRAAVVLPAAADVGPRVSATADLGIPGVGPFVTPNEDFYRIDTALVTPSVDAEDWRLRIHGMVERELTLNYHDLLDRDLIEREITLTCVSNEVGGEYVGNARWLGAPLADLLAQAGVDPAADQIVSRSADGWTAGTPTAVVTDGRDAMLAVAMNGEPLPLEHGFPVRMVVPGLYGYVSATKWVVDLELTTFDAYDAYWIRRGWAQQAPIKTQTRIDTPKAYEQPGVGVVPIAGVAWAQHRGISRVQVQVDDGPWVDATLGAQESDDTWRQWVYRWEATAGPHSILARATDGAGAVQTAEYAPVLPDGATGYPLVTLTVA